MYYTCNSPLNPLKFYQKSSGFILILFFHNAVTVREQPGQASLDDDGFKRSSDFSIAFCKVSRCLKKHLPKAKRLQEYLDSFSHPKHKRRRYIKRKVYKAKRSTRKILGALIPKYISATNIRLLQCIVESYGCPRCERILENYIKKHCK